MKVKNYKFLGLCILCFHCIFAQAQELLDYPLDTVNGEEVYRYQVERSIGLYRIGVNFNVPQSEIIRLNPQLRERGLHYAEILLIPTGRPVVIESKPKIIEKVIKEMKVLPLEEQPVAREATPAVQDTVTPEPQDAVEPEAEVNMQPEADAQPDESISPDNRRVTEIALMLPFESQQSKRSGNAERMMEVYQGALLALHDLQNDSIIYRLRVYDTERSERRVQALCDSTELDSVRGILGLVYPIQIERMANWCDVHKVPLLLPFSDDVDLASHPQVLQFNSTDKQEADSLCAWLLQQGEAIHCVSIDVRATDMTSAARTLRKQLIAHEIVCTPLPLRDLMNDSAAYVLDTEKENIFILHSDRYQQVRLLLPHIAKLKAEGYRVRIISQYAWQKEGIELPQVYTSMFTAENDREAYDALWSASYASEHVSEAPRYDLLGYDLMHALVQIIATNEAQAEPAAESETMNGLQSLIRWKQINHAGWQNECVKVIAY